MPTEATFLLAGLFIIAAATGWAFARFSDLKRDEAPPAPVSSDYLRGLNLVLNRQTDEALELFVRMAKVDEDTLETHFALGHLFRRRGEVDRAIRVHQNLLARPSLNEAQRHQALFSLAQDYLSAGLFDRAEKLFGELRSSSTRGEAALRNLVDIYVRQSDWSKAIEVHRALETLTLDREVVHLRDSLIPRYAEMIYYGYWFAPEREMLQAAINESQQNVTGTVRLKLYKGNVMVVGRKSDRTLYNPAVASFDESGEYQQADAEGFIRLNSLRLRIRGLAQK